MLRATEPAYRGRVMGMRILAILGLPLGLLLSGPLIDLWGFGWAWGLYSFVGILGALSMIMLWRNSLWRVDCAVNQPATQVNAR